MSVQKHNDVCLFAGCSFKPILVVMLCRFEVRYVLSNRKVEPVKYTITNVVRGRLFNEVESTPEDLHWMDEASLDDELGQEGRDDGITDCRFVLES
jgi:hypothetical protein